MGATNLYNGWSGLGVDLGVHSFDKFACSFQSNV